MRCGIIKWLPGAVVERRFSGQLLPSANNLIAIGGIKLDEPALAMGLLASDQRCAAATKTIEDDVAAARTVADGVGDKRDRLASE